jgi:integrase
MAFELLKGVEEAANLQQTNQEQSGCESTLLAQDSNSGHVLKFNDKEILKMPTSFRKTFRAEGQTICYRRRKRGTLYAYYRYEARYRRHGYNISVSAETLPELKQKFIVALHNAEQQANKPKVPIAFHEFTLFYFENFRKRKVTKKTLETDWRRYRKHIQPFIMGLNLRDVTPTLCQDILDKQLNDGFERNAQDIYSLLNGILKMAIAHGIIERNPLAVILPVTHEREHGKALTKFEEQKLISETAGTPYQLMFAVALYTGLRPNEYRSAKIEGEFIVAINSKRKTRKTEYKKIPITPMLRPYIQGTTKLYMFIPEVMRRKFKMILPNHILYDLRTTFYTRCQECGVADVARMEFVGHSLGKLGNAYTDLSDEFLLSEGNKLKY